jgi:uncharacterized protein YjlB
VASYKRKLQAQNNRQLSEKFRGPRRCGDAGETTSFYFCHPEFQNLGTGQWLRAFFASTCLPVQGEHPRDLARSSMSLLENIKKIVGKAIGRGSISQSDLAAVVRRRKAHRFRFEDDGVIPNHPKWPLVLYRSAVRPPNSLDPAAVLEDLFEKNGWDDSWRDGIYDYVHYHSRTHEVLGIACGNARVQFGGSQGRTLALKAGDVLILPAGTGHQCLAASKDFLVVGAYPPSGTYDECRTSSKERERALATIPKVGRPRKDPVYGKDGPLLQAWRRIIERSARERARR